MNFSDCPYPDCLFCLMRDTLSPSTRRSRLARYFKTLPASNEPGQVLAVSGLWNTAMLRPLDETFVEAGIFPCMASLILKGIRNRRWLESDQNIYIPYYAAHVIGSYTMVVEEFAFEAVKSGAIFPLVELLKGKLTWIEQRVALRALGHLATFECTLPYILEQKEILQVAMELAEQSLDTVYTQFYQSAGQRLEYHRDLLTRGLGGTEMESLKAEEWASQLQCWSLQLINCFTYRRESLRFICSRKDFLLQLLNMWGGVMNATSPAGVGLLHSICREEIGRQAVADCPQVIIGLCNVARSSDDWKYMAVDSLIWLVQDPSTQLKVVDAAVLALVDLAEISTYSATQKSIGKLLCSVLQDCPKSVETKEAIVEVLGARAKSKLERSLPQEELKMQVATAMLKRLEGNTEFFLGDISSAATKYSEALALCPITAKRARVHLYNNRAQCHLLQKNCKAAVSDLSRALCIDSKHRNSLWRRAQAYELLQLPKESLLDAIVYLNEATGKEKRGVTAYMEGLVRRQMQNVWLFKDAAERHRIAREDANQDSEWETADEDDNENE